MLGFKESPWIIHYDASSCNGCDIETLACLTPLFDVERLGVVNTGNPKHADIFLVTGAVNEQSKAVIRNIYEQLPEPKVVVAVGACACTGGIFRECYNVSGGVDTVIPVDVYVPGCAARPEAIIDGVVQGIAALQDKQQQMDLTRGAMDQVRYVPAAKADAPEILALQKIASQADAVLYGEENWPFSHQTLAELQHEFGRMKFIKAVINGKIIGSAGGFLFENAAHISGIFVHPYFQRRGIGERLLAEIERSFPDAKQFEISIGQKSEPALRRLKRQGYQEARTEPRSPGVTWVYLNKGVKLSTPANSL